MLVIRNPNSEIRNNKLFLVNLHQITFEWSKTDDQKGHTSRNG